MPKNTGVGLILAACATACGIALIWYMWWLVVVSFVALLVIAIGHTFNYSRGSSIPGEQVRETETARTQLLAGEA
jgi:cytochrome o ubiquinol oxidase subunit 1